MATAQQLKALLQSSSAEDLEVLTTLSAKDSTALLGTIRYTVSQFLSRGNSQQLLAVCRRSQPGLLAALSLPDRINFASGPLLKTPADVTAAINGDPTFERHVRPI